MLLLHALVGLVDRAALVALHNDNIGGVAAAIKSSFWINGITGNDRGGNWVLRRRIND
jgi:hypothetical protein